MAFRTDQPKLLARSMSSRSCEVMLLREIGGCLPARWDGGESSLAADAVVMAVKFFSKSNCLAICSSSHQMQSLRL